jgi:tight adherence protein C
MSMIFPVLLGLVAAAGAVMIAMGVRGSRAADPATLALQRLARQELGLGQSAIALELERPFLERLFSPGRRWLGRQMSRVTPATQAANFQKRLDFAGNPFGLDPAGMQTIRVVAAAALGTIGTALGVLTGSGFALGIFLVVGVAVGFYLPVLWLDQLVRARRAEIEAALPNALEDMAVGTGVDDFTALIRSIIHAERTGVPIARTIAAHAAQMRVKRRLHIRAEAARASLKILLPTVGCVFPTLWLILLGPALLVVLSISKH